MSDRFEPNVLDSTLDCLALAMSEFRLAVTEAIEPIADMARAMAPLLLKLRPKWRRRSVKRWGRR